MCVCLCAGVSLCEPAHVWSSRSRVHVCVHVCVCVCVCVHRCAKEGDVARVLSGLRAGPCPHITYTTASDATASHATLTVPRDGATEALPAIFAWLEQHKIITQDNQHDINACNNDNNAHASAGQHDNNAHVADNSQQDGAQGSSTTQAQQGSEGAGVSSDRCIVDYSVRQATLESVFLHMSGKALQESADT